MNQTNVRVRSLLTAAAAILVCCGAFASPARAQVKDGANYFSDDAERQASELIERIRKAHGKDVVIETVPALPGAPAPGAAREEFFQSEVSRRGKEAGVDGVYILVSRNPESFYVGVDPKTQERAFTLQDRGRLRDQLLASFKAKDFDGGIVAALKSVERTVAANTGTGNASAAAPAAGGAGAAANAPAGNAPPPAVNPGTNAPATKSTFSIGGLLCLGVGALVIFMLLRSVISRRNAGPAAGYGPHGGQPGFDPRTGQPYGQPGYDPRYPPQQQGGRGGLGTGLMGGVLGGLAGGYLYDKMSGSGGGGGGNEAQAATPNTLDPNTTPVESDNTSGFADFGSGGGDFGGGGGDFGGGDSGGGGDFGGGE